MTLLDPERTPDPPADLPGAPGRSAAGAARGLFLLAAFYTLFFARSFLLPIVLAVLLSLFLSPLVRGLKRLRIPEPAGAALVLLLLLGTLGFGLYSLSGPAYEWMQRAPVSLHRVETRLRELKRGVQTFGRATEQVAKIAQVSPGPRAPVAVPAAPSLEARLVDRTTEIVAGGAVTFILLYFLLGSGDLFLRKLVKVLSTVEDKKRATEIARKIQTDISAYLSTVALINLGLGLAVAAAMAWIGLPNPLLWGVMVTLSNFVPYLGAGCCYAVFAMVGLLTFDDLGHAFLPVGAFFCLNVAEAYFIAPWVLGRRLTLNPVVIFLGLTFWGWLWGVTGAILAVPILVVVKILCDQIEPLAAIGEFLGD